MRWRTVSAREGYCGGTPCVHEHNIPTRVLAQRFRAGDSVSALAVDYRITAEQVEDALRWELLSSGARKKLLTVSRQPPP